MPVRKPHPNARSLRRNMPEVERRLWAQLRNKNLGGFRFRRQHTVGPYIVDFACVEVKVVIECDGEQHGLGAAPFRDAVRDRYIKSKGWAVLRFWNHEIYKNINGVLETILNAAETSVQRRMIDSE